MTPPDHDPRSVTHGEAALGPTVRGYDRIRTVASFDELLDTPLTEPVNAVCWQRQLDGDFAEVVRLLAARDGVTTIDEDLLRALPLGKAGQLAAATLIADLAQLRARGHEPVLECIRGYPRDDDSPLPTDVYSFHVDSATVPTDTILCSYTAPASEGLRNDEAQRQIDVPAVRARLLAHFGGRDDAEFVAYVRANFFDLHYAARAGTRPFSFGVGNLWRLAVAHPLAAVVPCIHRAPSTAPAALPRLLLIS